MRLMRNITIAALSFLVTFAIGMMARAQATNSVTLALQAKSFQVSTADDTAKVDLVKEVKKINPAALASGSLQLQMLRVITKTGVGGAQLFLMINGEYVDSQSVETDPDQFATADTLSAARVELKNIERDQIKDASLVIQGYSNSKILSVEVVIGEVTEVAILGHYADEQVQMIGGNSPMMADVAPAQEEAVVLKPTADVIANVQSRYYAAGSLGVTPPTDPSQTAASANVAAATPAAGTGSNIIANQLAQTLTAAAAVARHNQDQYQQQPAQQTAYTASAATVASVQQQPAPISNSSTRQTTVVASATSSSRRSTVADTATKPVEKSRLCVTNRRGNHICTGDKVKNRWGFSGVVQDLKNQNGQNMVLVKFGFGDTKWREVDSVSN